MKNGKGTPPMAASPIMLKSSDQPTPAQMQEALKADAARRETAAAEEIDRIFKKYGVGFQVWAELSPDGRVIARWKMQAL